MKDSEIGASLPQTYTVEQVAECLQLHPVYARDLFRRGKVPGAIRIGGRWRLPAPRLTEILANGLRTGGRN